MEDKEQQISKLITKQNELVESIRKANEALNKDYASLESQISSLKAQQKEIKEFSATLTEERHKQTAKGLQTTMNRLIDEYTPTHGR
jgi:uncharacterized protein YoxC